MELELKHLLSYLPYGLDCQYKGIINGKEISKHKKDFEKENTPYPNWSYYEPLEGIEGLKVAPLKTIRVYKKYWVVTCGIFNIGQKGFYKGVGIKPILRPLLEFGDSDDLRKILEFIGLGRWCEAYDTYFDAWFNDACNIDKLVLQAPYEVFQYFLANHYDVFGLISNNLAIDINTLKQ